MGQSSQNEKGTGKEKEVDSEELALPQEIELPVLMDKDEHLALFPSPSPPETVVQLPTAERISLPTPSASTPSPTKIETITIGDSKDESLIVDGLSELIAADARRDRGLIAKYQQSPRIQRTHGRGHITTYHLPNRNSNKSNRISNRSVKPFLYLKDVITVSQKELNEYVECHRTT